MQEDVHVTDKDRHRHRCHGLPHMRRGHTSQTKSRSLESAEEMLQATSTIFATSRVHPFSPLNTCPVSHISTLGKSVRINMTAVATSGPNAHHHKPAWTGSMGPPPSRQRTLFPTATSPVGGLTQTHICITSTSSSSIALVSSRRPCPTGSHRRCWALSYCVRWNWRWRHRWTYEAVLTCPCHAGRAPALRPWSNLVVLYCTCLIIMIIILGKKYMWVQYTTLGIWGGTTGPKKRFDP